MFEKRHALCDSNKDWRELAYRSHDYDLVFHTVRPAGLTIILLPPFYPLLQFLYQNSGGS